MEGSRLFARSVVVAKFVNTEEIVRFVETVAVVKSVSIGRNAITAKNVAVKVFVNMEENVVGAVVVTPMEPIKDINEVRRKENCRLNYRWKNLSGLFQAPALRAAKTLNQ